MPASEEQIVVFQPNETVRLDVRLENETVWLTQDQMSLLFGRDQSVIARCIGSIFKEGELDRLSVHAKNACTAAEKEADIVELNVKVGKFGIIVRVRGKTHNDHKRKHNCCIPAERDHAACFPPRERVGVVDAGATERVVSV